MRNARSWLLLVSGLSLGFAIGCNDGGGGDAASAYINKLKTCGLLSEGELPSVDSSELDQDVACYLDCAIRATCEELTALTCNPEELVPSAALVECYEACESGGEGNFTCGDGETVPGEWECDGEPDCNDGSDEAGCATFMCADGSGNIPESWQCDGGMDCNDGSDEDGCPGFACADGSETVPTQWQCDGEADCEDGSDELGCPSYTCANGEQVVDGARCDLSVDCEDGSDEAGCAQLVCPEP